MNIDVKNFAKEWADSWNGHDLEKILSHYADDFEITTPMIKVAMGIETGTLKGKEAIGKYWEAAFKKVPDLHFEIIEVTESINSIAIYYKSVLGKMAIEVLFFDQKNKIKKVIAYYN